MKHFKQRFNAAMIANREAGNLGEAVDTSKAIADLLDEAEARMAFLEKVAEQAVDLCAIETSNSGNLVVSPDIEHFAGVEQVPELYAYLTERNTGEGK